MKNAALMELADRLARSFHEAYERLAPSFGYETRTDTREFDPESQNGRLMIAVCAELQSQLRAAASGVVCHCAACDPPTFGTRSYRMVLCGVCGNKRCPHAEDHRYACTGSNATGQTPVLSPHGAEARDAERIAFCFEHDEWEFSHWLENGMQQLFLSADQWREAVDDAAVRAREVGK